MIRVEIFLLAVGFVLAASGLFSGRLLTLSGLFCIGAALALQKLRHQRENER